jgi:hypothetical protein
MNFNDKHLEILHRVQPHLKDLYNRATEIMPPLYMSDRCTEVIELLQLEDINDETKDSIKNIQRKLLSRLLKETLQNVPFYQKNVKLDPDSINPGNAIETLFEFPFISKQDIMNNPADFISKKFIKFFLILPPADRLDEDLDYIKRSMKYRSNMHSLMICGLPWDATKKQKF